MIDTRKYDVGVIVGRFQVPDLHDGHKKLIDYVFDRHSKTIIVLGMSQVINTINNPLDFEARKQMILYHYPRATVTYIKDTGNDWQWSCTLDRIVGDLISPTQTAILYGSRDSFINCYEGRYDTYELLQENYVSGTDIRRAAKNDCRPSEDFRAGVIWASANRFPTVYPCVDIAIFTRDSTEILLGKKDSDTHWRLIGGFADPRSPSFEHDARREMFEETKLTADTLTYLDSFLVDDWRYRKEPDVIKTLLFKATTLEQYSAKASDDIAEVQWFDVNYVKQNPHIIMKGHQHLVERALNA